MSQEGPPSANGPGKGRRPRAFGLGLWEKVGEGAAGWVRADFGNQGASAGRGPRHCSQLALISREEQVSCVRSAPDVSGHLRVYLYSVCDAKSRSAGGGGEEGVWGEGEKTSESRGERRRERETERERGNGTSSPFAK